MKEVRDYLKESGMFFIATIDGDKPRVRPFGTAEEFEGKLYIQTGKSKNVSKQIQKNPKVELCCFDGSTGRWLRLAGELIRDDRREAKADMLEHYPELKNMYSADDDNTEVLYFKNATATIASFSAAPQVIKF